MALCRISPRFSVAVRISIKGTYRDSVDGARLKTFCVTSIPPQINLRASQRRRVKTYAGLLTSAEAAVRWTCHDETSTSGLLVAVRRSRRRCRTVLMLGLCLRVSSTGPSQRSGLVEGQFNQAPYALLIYQTKHLAPLARAS